MSYKYKETIILEWILFVLQAIVLVGVLTLFVCSITGLEQNNDGGSLEQGITAIVWALLLVLSIPMLPFVLAGAITSLVFTLNLVKCSKLGTVEHNITGVAVAKIVLGIFETAVCVTLTILFKEGSLLIFLPLCALSAGVVIAYVITIIGCFKRRSLKNAQPNNQAE